MDRPNHLCNNDMRFPNGAKHLEEVDVNEDVFLTLLMADGEPKENAEKAAHYCRMHHTRILIRDRLVGIRSALEDYSAEG